VEQKNTFSTIFILTVTILLLLPFLVSFSEIITKIVERLVLYKALQDYVVPLQAILVGYLIRPLGVTYMPLRDGMLINGVPLKITWNCVGWQSMLLFTLSVIFGLRARIYSKLSVFKTIFIGVFGTVLVNLGRIFIVSLLGAYSPKIFAIVYHDYLAAFLTILWLFIFWWFSYSFLLEEK